MKKVNLAETEIHWEVIDFGIGGSDGKEGGSDGKEGGSDGREGGRIQGSQGGPLSFIF